MNYLRNMADLKPGGANEPDEKSGNNAKNSPKAKAGEKSAEGGVSAKKGKNALRRRRTIQRRKFLGDLQKAGISKGPVAKKTGKVQARPEITEKISQDEEMRPEEANLQDEEKPSEEIKAPGVPGGKEEAGMVEETGQEEASRRAERTREELHPRAQNLAKEEKIVSEEEKNVKDEDLSAQEAETEDMSVSSEEKAVAENETLSEEKDVMPAEDDRQRTYFAHPFGDDENVQNASPPDENDQAENDQDDNLQATPSSDEDAQIVNSAEEEPQELPDVVEEANPPALPAEDDAIIFGTPKEKAPPMPVGRIKAVETKEEATEEPLFREEKSKKTAHETDSEKQDGEETGKVEVSDVSETAKNKSELLVEKKSLIKTLQERLMEKLKGMPKGKPVDLSGLKQALTKLASIFRPGFIITLLFLALVTGGGYWLYVQGWPEKIGAYVTDYFKPKPVVKVDVKVNPDDQRIYGLVSAGIFAQNRGSKNDLLQVQIKLADYFGNRREPRVSGETGISAATFYGALKDEAGTVNQFVAYMKKLEELQNLYKTDVYAMLDGSTHRDKALLDYLEKMKKARADSQELLSRVRTNLDDFNVSHQSLTPDKAKYEKDFFAAMEGLQPDKSDLLLKGFIDISQKQTALKARINALLKLVSYYESAIKRLDTRISAIEQNRDAIIQGIRVVDVPGANLDIIIRPSTTVTRISN